MITTRFIPGVLAAALLLSAACSADETSDTNAAGAASNAGGATVPMGGGGSGGAQGSAGGETASYDYQVTQYYPYLEWSLDNTSHAGNPFDLIASVTFTHTASNEEHSTEMFYVAPDSWHFRFTGTQLGAWSYLTSSSDPELDGHSGTILVQPNPDPKAHGFIKTAGNKWAWSGTEQAFIPQIVMAQSPPDYYAKPEVVDQTIATFFDQHGFNGLHTMVFCRWLDFDQTSYDKIDQADPNPDPRTFEALELLISKTHAAGGMVHIWAWGDEQRKMTPIKWGINGVVDQRLQRHIAARLGPLPGWTMGYGFDNFEWVSGAELDAWRSYMHAHLGWSHLLGARSGGPHSGTDHSKQQLSETLDYSGYEHWKPSYDVYVAAIEARADKPTMSEDRFRVRNKHPKDYDLVMTRRGLWHSAMAGGVANIWGNYLPEPPASGASLPYPNPDWIKTNALFFADRFKADLIVDNSLTDGTCLKRPGSELLLFYKEASTSIEMDLSALKTALAAIAVDTKSAYAEIDIGPLNPGKTTWNAPHQSDWAIAVGTP